MTRAVRHLRDAALVGGLALWVAFLVPPASGWATRYEFANALQFGVFAFWAPVLVVVGAPWRHTRAGRALGAGEPASSWLARWWVRRESVSREARAAWVTAIFIVVEVVWRVAPVVDHVSSHPWGQVLEAVSLALAGGALFLSLVESPPLSPGTKRVFRIFMAALSMWAVWIVGYMDGMTGAEWYRVFHHALGGLSLSADKEISAGLLWLTSAVTFIPIVFWNLVHWLQSEATPDEEMYDLVREDRTRGFFGPG